MKPQAIASGRKNQRLASIAFGYPQRIFGVNPNPPQSKNVAIFSIIAAFHRQAGKLHGILNLQRFSAQHLYN